MQGEEVVIAKSGKPLVRLVRTDKGKSSLGSATGSFLLPEGWDAPLNDKELEDLFGN